MDKLVRVLEAGMKNCDEQYKRNPFQTINSYEAINAMLEEAKKDEVWNLGRVETTVIGPGAYWEMKDRLKSEVLEPLKKWDEYGISCSPINKAIQALKEIIGEE